MVSPVTSILIIRLSSIGDIILTTPLLRALRKAYPLARIDYCTKAVFSSLLINNPHLSTIYSYEQLPQVRYDVVVDLQNNRRSRRLIRSLPSGRVCVYHKNNWKKWLQVHCHIALKHEYKSVVERYRGALSPLKIALDNNGCELFPSVEDRKFATPFFAFNWQTLAVCFGANHFTKRYPLEHFVEVITRLCDVRRVHIFLLGGKEEAQEALQLMQLLPEHIRPMANNFTGRCSLMQSAALLERCDAVLCNDTGLMHMASALRKQLFVLFGSSSPSFGFLPYNVPYELFEVSGLLCRPCSHIGKSRCPKKHFRCMNDIHSDYVAERLITYFSS